MSLKNMDIGIDFDESNTEIHTTNSSISGVVKITPKVDLTIDFITGDVCYVLKGKMRPYDKMIERVILLDHSKLFYSGQIYEFSFSVNLKNNITSYKGINASITHRFDVGIDIHQEDLNNLGILSTLKKLISNDSTVKLSRYFNYEDGSSKYRIESARLELTRNFEYGLILLFATIIVAIAFCFLPDFRTLYVVSTVVSSALLGVIIQLFYLEYTKLDIEIEFVNNDDNTFTLVPILKDNRDDYKSKFYYGIYENVVDSRGTRSISYKSRIYLSEDKTMSKSIKQRDIVFNFPERNNLNTIAITNFDLIWVVYLSHKDVFGLEAKYEVEIIVERI